MERGPLLSILESMIGTDKELDLVLLGEADKMSIRNVESVERLMSSNGIRIRTKQNDIWVDASHVSAAWQARDDY